MILVPSDYLSRVEHLGVEFAAECRRVEADLLSLGIVFRQELIEVACEVGLTGRSFAFPQHSYVFAVLCCVAEDGLRPSLKAVLNAAHEFNVPLTLDDLTEIVTDGPWPGSEPLEDVRELAAIVREYEWRREQARKRLHELERLLRGQPRLINDRQPLVRAKTATRRRHGRTAL